MLLLKTESGSAALWELGGSGKLHCQGYVRSITCRDEGQGGKGLPLSPVSADLYTTYRTDTRNDVS
jgi:hypothetical protein